MSLFTEAVNAHNRITDPEVKRIIANLLSDYSLIRGALVEGLQIECGSCTCFWREDSRSKLKATE
jgi:bacterioferritin-associated ferredoxin